MRKATSILFLLFLSFVTLAQKGQPQEVHFNRLFVKDGLPQGSVESLVQDRQGYLWIATEQGVVRYDGYSPRVYDFGIENPTQKDILTIYLDRQGRLWAGGRDGGLFLYDRSDDRFIQYKSNPTVSDSSARLIFLIHDDRAGHIWLLYWNELRSRANLERFDLTSRKFVKYGNEEKGAHYINAVYFSNFCEDDKGVIWVGTNNGIYRYNEKTDHFEPHLAFDDPEKQNSFAFGQDAVFPTDTLWIAVWESKPPGTKLGLWSYDTRTGHTTVFRHQTNDSSSIASDFLTAGCADSLGRLWAATDKGLSLYVPSKNNFINYYLKDNRGTNTYIREIQVDKNNNFWLATGLGLVFFNTHTTTFTPCPADVTDPYGLASNNVHPLFMDHSGTLWLGASNLGLQWINKSLSKFMQHKENPGQPHHFPGGLVNAFSESKGGIIWLATARGLYHWQPTTDSFTLVKFTKGQNSDFNVSSVLVDNKGLIWCGVSKRGLYCYDSKTGKTKIFNNNEKDTTSIPSNDIAALLEDHLGNIWVGTQSGICRFNEQGQHFTRYPYIINTQFFRPVNGPLDDDGALQIYEDKSGTIWVGTNDGGLNRFNRQTGKFTSYNNEVPGFQCITSIHQDAGNILWVGTPYGGVFSFDPQTRLAKKYSEKDGLLYDGASGIVEDEKGNLWFASPRGISIFNPQTKQVRNLTAANYLPSENLLSAFKTSSGQFLFNSNDGGFISLKPDDFTPDPHAPVVNIESVDYVTLFEGKAKDSTIFTYGKDSINFPYNENRLTFHYVGLYYQNPQLNQYACKLDGYDKDWVPAGTQRLVTYTNLSPGHYTFHVKAANSDGVWNEQGASFSFAILPPWWQTWWAYSLYLFLLMGAVWTFIKWRTGALQKEKIVLEKRVDERTTELKEEKEIVESTLAELKSTQAQLIQSEKMASLGELTSGIAHEIKNPLNFINNFSEINIELISEIEEEQIPDLNEDNLARMISDIKTLKNNSEKINSHGKRIDGIVKGMLQHSRLGNLVKEPVNINALCEESLKLAYHGFKAKEKTFNASFETRFDPDLPRIMVIPQDFGRVMLNLLNNAFYTVNEKQKRNHTEALDDHAGPAYKPSVIISTKKSGNKIIITVSDNGMGIPPAIINKIFQPFFTTKPTGDGTGLGLSMSYDIITKGHGGELWTKTTEGLGTDFEIILPI